MLPIDIPFRQFFDLDGNPLDGGYIYVGQPNLDPETSPITVYWDAAGTQPVAQPIRTLNGYMVRDGAAAVVFTGAEYSITIKNQYSQLVYSAPDSSEFDSSTSLRDISNDTNPALGVALVGGAGRVVNSIATLRTLPKTGSKNACVTGYYASGDGGGGVYYYDAADTTTADNGGTVIVASDGGRWKLVVTDEISVRQFGAKGDGTTNDTSALQACYTAGAGKTIDHGDGYTYLISTTLNVATGSRYVGRSKIKAMNGANIATSMLYGSAVSGVRISDLEIDGNADNSGTHNGIMFHGGSHNHIEHSVYVHDTMETGCISSSETGSTVRGRYINCGRNGLAGNHGIIVYSLDATPAKDVTVSAYVKGAYRKGITTYAAGPGQIIGVRIENCDVSNCGLAGIYAANDPAGIVQESLIISNNRCAANYLNFGIVDARSVAGTGNISIGSTGSSGVLIEDSYDINFGVVDTDSVGAGIRITNCSRVSLLAPTVSRANRGLNAFGPGITFNGSSYCIAQDPMISDDTGPRMTHGIIEEGSSNNNQILGGVIKDATIANVTVIGANTGLHRTSSRNHGFGTTTPLNTVDISGGLTIRGQNLTVANGLNSGVALPTNAGMLTVIGPTSAYSIGGIVGGHDGRSITLINYTTQTLTLVHQDAAASAANRFILAGNANKTVLSFGAVELRYSAQAGAWVVIG